VPTEHLLELLHPRPLLTYLEETGMVKRQAIVMQLPVEEAQTEEKKPEEITIDDDSYVAVEETLYVSRNYLRSRTVKAGEPGVSEPPSVVLPGMLQIVSSLVRKNGQTLHLLPFKTSSGSEPMDLKSDMGLVTAKQLTSYFGKILAENPGKSGFVQFDEQQVREGKTWKQIQFKPEQREDKRQQHHASLGVAKQQTPCDRNTRSMVRKSD
jgi:hypothetical protein